MFEGQAEKAMNFYISLFPDSRVESIDRYGPNEPGAEGSVRLAVFTIAGQTAMCIDSPAKHAFTFTPSISFFVDLDSEEALEHAARSLTENGAVLMPLDNYGFSRRFTWVNDRFGVSWQLNLP
jgi:predicted 3-demethylubiquinone-9 3-methyltransferase (glyoxalase superfamily)